jgi:hypothetical protein
LEGPEAVLCDLNEQSLNAATQDLVEIFAHHNFLTEYAQSQDLNALINEVLVESSLKTLAVVSMNNCTAFIEKRILGTDKRVKKFPKVFLDYVKKLPEWQKHYKDAKHQIKKRKLNVVSKSVSASNGQAQKMHDFVLKHYRQLYGNGSLELAKFSDQVCYGFWSQLPKKFASIVFILKAALKYYLGYLEEIGHVDARLIEYHIDPGSKQLLVMNSPVDNRDILVVDRSYSGNTLENMQDMVNNEGANSSILAICPKSVSAAKKCDYFLFLDKIIERNQVDMGKEGWETDLFRNIVNNES